VPASLDRSLHLLTTLGSTVLYERQQCIGSFNRAWLRVETVSVIDDCRVLFRVSRNTALFGTPDHSSGPVGLIAGLPVSFFVWKWVGPLTRRLAKTPPHGLKNFVGRGSFKEDGGTQHNRQTDFGRRRQNRDRRMFRRCAGPLSLSTTRETWLRAAGGRIPFKCPKKLKWRQCPQITHQNGHSAASL